MIFETLGLAAELLRAVADEGYSSPTPIQEQAIPPILQGHDIFASAQTGTGKTAGFTLPLLQRLSSQPVTEAPRAPRAQDQAQRPLKAQSQAQRGPKAQDQAQRAPKAQDQAQRAPKAQDQAQRAPKALILTPTRELAAQVNNSVNTYGKYLPIKSVVVFGGVGIVRQIQALKRGCDIVVATPGRLLDHMGQGTIDLSKIEILVLDECDRMLDMGFIRDIRKILAQLPDSRQTLMFSATFSASIRKLASQLLHNPVQIEISPQNTAAEQVEQHLHPVDKSRKRELLSYLIGFNNWRQVLVFTRTKHGANRLAEQLAKDGLTTAAIHGNKSQAARTRALGDFKKGKVRVLVATDVASRGLDIDQLPYVVNFELPNVPEDYVHRIGRTGRAGNEGQAISLVSNDEQPLLKGIEKLLNRKLAQDVVPGYEPTAAPTPRQGEEPQKRQRSKSRRSRRSSSNSQAGSARSGRRNTGN